MTRAPEALRVALLNPWFWPEVERGSERIMHDLAVDLRALGHTPRLLVSHPGRPRRTTEDGVEILRSWRPPERLLRLRNVQGGATHVPFSYAALRAGQDDVAHAFYPTDAVAAIAWARRAARPAVFSFMGIPLRDALSNLRGRMRALERATRESDAVVVLSRAARDEMWRWLGVESEVIYPGIDLDAFAPGPGRADAPTLLCAADVTEPRKRVSLLVRAFGRVRRSRPSARLLLIAPRDRAARAAFDEPGVEWRERGPHTVVDAYREAWASGVASYGEAFGLVFVESLACGTPVFGARDGGVPEIVDRPEVGRLFDGDDEADVARAMLETLELAEDPATAAACRRRAHDFTTMSGAAAHTALYRRLLSG